ncbi:MAG TPA: hypothetical protein VF997_23885 [Polyangia bacterium]
MDDASQLGYPRAWVDFGLLERPLLADQLARFRAGEECALEHYRFAAFQRLLRRRELGDELVDKYVRLAELDPDRHVATSALCGLLDHPALTDAQLARLEPVVAGNPLLEKRLQRVRLSRR